jgi:hypothetical protein
MFDITTHNGTITVESPTGQHKTFDIRTQKPDANFAPGERVLALLAGPDNTSDYQGIGFVKPGGRIVLWKRYRNGDMPAVVKVLQHPEHYKKLGMKYHHEGRCIRCNRKLTTPESIESGIGPVCAGLE